MGQRIGSNLELDVLRDTSVPALHVPRRDAGEVGPETLPLPASFRIVNPAVHSASKEAKRIGLRITTHSLVGIRATMESELLPGAIGTCLPNPSVSKLSTQFR